MFFFFFSTHYSQNFFSFNFQIREEKPQKGIADFFQPTLAQPVPALVPKPVVIPDLPKAPEKIDEEKAEPIRPFTEPEYSTSIKQTNLPSPLKHKKTEPERDVQKDFGERIN